MVLLDHGIQQCVCIQCQYRSWFAFHLQTKGFNFNKCSCARQILMPFIVHTFTHTRLHKTQCYLNKRVIFTTISDVKPFTINIFTLRLSRYNIHICDVYILDKSCLSAPKMGHILTEDNMQSVKEFGNELRREGKGKEHIYDGNRS